MVLHLATLARQQLSMEGLRENVEELQLTMEENLLRLNVQSLERLAEKLEIADDQWHGKHKLVIIRCIRNFCESDGDVNGDEEVTLNLREKRITDVLDAIEHTNATKSASNSQMPPPGSFNVLKKEFVLVGKVGDPTNEKDVGYLGVVRQMKEGLQRGFPESEVVAAVLKAIIPKSLRTYLGMLSDLNISRLSQTLRIHYQEKSATELYQELITMSQSKKEDPTVFLVRAMETREKILFASKEEGEVSYDQCQVQKLFLATVESGIDQEVATMIRSFLRTTASADDMMLMNEVSKAQATRKSRLQKSQGDKRRTPVPIDAIELNQPTPTLQKSVETLARDVEKLSAEIASLKSGRADGLDNRLTSGPYEGHNQDSANVNVQRNRSGKCQACFEANVRCDHCFKCGEYGHVAYGCRKSVNFRGLSSRGVDSP